MSSEDVFENRRNNYSALVNAGITIPYKFENVTPIAKVREYEPKVLPGQVLEDRVRVAGTLVGFREHGQLSFLDLQDLSGDIQIMTRPNELGPTYGCLRQLDLGDVIGVDGKVMKSKRGELSILADKYSLLAKCFYPLPNLRDAMNVETRYRQRYIDLKTNPGTRETFVKRAKIVTAMREFLDNRGFIETEIPTLQPVYGGASAKPFKTHVNALNEEWYLSISPELYLKRLISGGMEKVYTITHNFRNEDIDTTHNPEFTAVETYEAYADLYDVMAMTEQMLNHIAKKATGSETVPVQGTEVSFKLPFQRMTMEEAVRQHAGVSLQGSDLPVIAEGLGLPKDASYPNVIGGLFEKYVEKRLVQPTFIHDYPIDNSPLTRKHRSKPGWVERFELFVNGMELANAYTELVDPFDQKERFDKQVEERKRGNEEAHPMDEDFVTALMYGTPPTGGLGIGIDRLVMLLTGKASIKDVLLFPMVKRIA